MNTINPLALTTSFLDLRVTALQPIVHSEGVFGNISTFRRQKRVLSNGRVVEIPSISGNAARNMLRRAIMWHMVEVCELAQLDKRTVNLLFSGGVLDDSSKSMDVGQYYDILKLIPALGLFGGGVGNALIPGSLSVSSMIPVCEETTTLSSTPIPEPIIPERYHAPPVSAYMDTFQGTRKELFTSQKYRGLLPPDEQEEHQKQLVEKHSAKKEAAVKGKKAEKDKGDSHQMIYHFECMAPGTVLHWRVGVNSSTALEYEALLTGLAILGLHAHVGAKSAVGFGQIKLECRAITMPTPSMSTENLPALKIGQAYQEHLVQHKEEITAKLQELGETKKAKAAKAKKAKVKP